MELKKKEQSIFVTRTSMPPYEEYVEMIKPLWDTHWLTNMGQYHQKLENELREYLQVEQLSLLVNGHMSLEMAIQAMEFPEGSEVITTPFTFVSTTHAIVRNRLKPVFCDIKPDDFTIDETKIENLITEKTVAIVPVHVYGNICNVEAIEQIAKKHGLRVIYDAAHAFGETYKEYGIGCFGDASIFSFHATKVYNTIEGGAVASKSRKLYEKLYNLKNFGIKSENEIIDIGVNAKMNEFAAIMGLCNLKYVAKNIQIRKKKVQLYNEQLAGISCLRTPRFDNSEVKYNYAYYPVIFSTEKQRDEVYDTLKKKNIYSRKYFYPLTSDAICFGNEYKADSLDVARDISSRVLVLPLYPELEDETIVTIAQVIDGLYNI